MRGRGVVKARAPLRLRQRMIDVKNPSQSASGRFRSPGRGFRLTSFGLSLTKPRTTRSSINRAADDRRRAKGEPMKAGCYTALITPFQGQAVDWKGLDQLVEFQIACGITGILAVGTTGESPVLAWDEHNTVTTKIAHGVPQPVPVHRRHRQQQHRGDASKAPARRQVRGPGRAAGRPVLQRTRARSKSGANTWCPSPGPSRDGHHPLRHPRPHRGPTAARGPGPALPESPNVSTVKEATADLKKCAAPASVAARITPSCPATTRSPSTW